MKLFQRSFTEDSFIGQCDIEIPREVLEGQTYQQWYPLLGRETNSNDNQGDIFIIMSLTVNSCDTLRKFILSDKIFYKFLF